MAEQLYVVGEKFGSGYPDGLYVARLLEGKHINYYIIIGVLEIPSVRAVANSEAWSNATIRKYESLAYFPKDERIRQPQIYDGEWVEDSEEEYNRSYTKALIKSIQHYQQIGDTEAVDRLLEMKKG